MKDNRLLRILIDLALIILGIIFLVFGIKDMKDMINANKIEDNVRFKKEYSYVSKDNIYKYTDLKELSKLLDDGKYVILIGNKKDPWTQVLVSPLNDVIKDTKIKNIYYLDMSNVDKNDKNYNKILSKLKIEKFEVPMIVFTNDIKILVKNDIYNKEYTDAPIDYWDDEKIVEFNKLIKNNLK